MEKQYPKVGVGVMIQNEKGEVLLGLRQGSHGAGEWAFPGGHLEFGEIIFEAVKREAKEEVGLEINELELISVSDETRYIKTDGKHYVVLGFKAKYKNGEPRLMEPEKFKEWRWFGLANLPNNLFQGTGQMINNFKAGKIY